MTDPFVAEIRIFTGNFAPKGWAQCNGQLLPLSQNTALFSLLGTYYGGDGKSTFALPNLQNAVPIHQGQGPGLSARFIGEQSGSDSVTLLPTEVPVHTHGLQGSSIGADDNDPGTDRLLTSARGAGVYNTVTTPVTQLHPSSLAVSGSSLPHNNLQPYLVVTFIIAMQGVFPPRS
jgi:microcystin-dependent protein